MWKDMGEAEGGKGERRLLALRAVVRECEREIEREREAVGLGSLWI